MPVPFLKKYGHKVLANGYEVVGITPGTKHPSYDYSSKKLPKITVKHLDKLLANGHAKDGLGIRAALSPMLDIDCTYQPRVDETREFAENMIGWECIARIGAAPKIGLIFRSETPFKKITSKAFTDPNGNKAQVEFLGDGQQFVALAIHPDTKKKYSYPDKGMNPIRVPRSDLPVVTERQALAVVNFFEQRCIDDGWLPWKEKKKSTALTVINGGRDPDDLLGSQPCGLTIEEVEDWCERLDNDESVDYESDDYHANVLSYRNVLFAIWHETEGSPEGREIAWEWSSKSPKHEKEPGRFFKLWNSADPEGRSDAITFRYIIKQVLEQEADERKEVRDGYLDSLRNCTDADDLKELGKLISRTKFDDLDTQRIAHAFKDAMKRIAGVTISIGTAKKAIYHEPETDDLPKWVENIVYIENSMRFFNTETGVELEHKAFDAKFSRYLGGASAVEFALHQAKIRTYYLPMYKPGDEDEFIFDGKECINTFSERLMPEMPKTFSEKDLHAISIVRDHIANVLPDKRERRLFTSYLAHIVQTYLRPNWAIVLQGTEGDGKSFFFDLMGCVLGSNNVRMIDAPQLEDKYTAWAVGQCFTFIAELRIIGHNRYNILDKIKPFITDNAINIHPKNVNPYTAFNTTAYLATTNHRDALPINDNDRRWMILYSAWLTGERIRAFEKENPGYFDRLFSTIDGPDARPGAIRKWLMNYKLHPEFKPKGRAPWTHARDQMIALSKSDMQTAFEDLIRDDDHPQIGADLVVASALTDYLQMQVGEEVKTRALSGLLSQCGYEKLRHRINLSNESKNRESVWVKSRSDFDERTYSSQRYMVRKFLKGRQALITHRDEI